MGRHREWSPDQVKDEGWQDVNIQPCKFRYCPRVVVDMDCDECDHEGRSLDNPAVRHGLFLSKNNAARDASNAISTSYFYPEDEYEPDEYIGGDWI